jgi:YVTN family beta-propeller protein
VDTLPSGPDPELFVQDAAGKILYVANENDNTVTIIDIEKRARLGEFQVGVEPEGMAISPDGKILINTSETTNMAHFIDTATRQIVANVLVDARPRFAEFKRDGSELWVSSEIGGTVSRHRSGQAHGHRQDQFNIPGLRREAIQPVGISITKPTARPLSSRSARQPRRGRRCHEPSGHQISAGRPAGLAHGVHAGREISAGHQRRIERRLGDRRRGAQKVIKTIQVGELPWGITICAAMMTASTRCRRNRNRRTPVPGPILRRRAVDRGVSHSYGARRALDDVSFTVAPASFTALLGLNGAGKSTLFSLITRLFGIRRPDASASSAMTSARAGEALRLLGVVFQPRTLDLDLSVTQNLPITPRCTASPARGALARARCWRASALPTAPAARCATSRRPDAAAGDRARAAASPAPAAARRGDRRPRRQGARRHPRPRPQLVTEQGIGVLWATHLFDEITARAMTSWSCIRAGFSRRAKVAHVIAKTRGARHQFRVHALTGPPESGRPP